MCAFVHVLLHRRRRFCHTVKIVKLKLQLSTCAIKFTKFITMVIVRYTQTAASSKDVVILLDLSGNLEQPSIEMAKETAKKIIETLGDDDYLNVIKVSLLHCVSV